MLRVLFSHCYAECRHVKCHYAECRHVECHYVECLSTQCCYAECGDAPCGTVGTVKIYYRLKIINLANLVLTNPPDYLLTTTKTQRPILKQTEKYRHRQTHARTNLVYTAGYCQWQTRLTPLPLC
jgi:hypothetical protein